MPFYSEFDNSLHYQIGHVSKETIRLMQECKWEFNQALGNTKECAFRAACKKVKPNTLTRKALEDMVI